MPSTDQVVHLPQQVLRERPEEEHHIINEPQEEPSQNEPQVVHRDNLHPNEILITQREPIANLRDNDGTTGVVPRPVQPWLGEALRVPHPRTVTSFLLDHSRGEREDEDGERVDEDGERSDRVEKRPSPQDDEREEREEGHDDEIDAHLRHRAKRLKTVMEETSLSFYEVIPEIPEVPLVLWEYGAPCSYFLLFSVPSLHFTSFAFQWGVLVFVVHFWVVALTHFGGHSGKLCFKPWIPGHVHTLLDYYLFNNPLVTAMLLFPHWFNEHNPSMVSWLALASIPPANWNCISALKEDYKYHQPLIKSSRIRRRLKSGFLNMFLAAAVAWALLVMAQWWSLPWLLEIGLVAFNLPPAVFVYAHQQRIRQGSLPTKSEVGSKGK